MAGFGRSSWSRRERLSRHLVTWGLLTILPGWAPSSIAAPPSSETGDVTVRVSAAVDGFVVDSNFDGMGDWAWPLAGSVVVGWNHPQLSRGENRGVYEFDLTSMPVGSHIVSARLGLKVGGTNPLFDPNLFPVSVYEAPGNGQIGLGDFSSGTLSTSFVPFQHPRDGWPFSDDVLDVTLDNTSLCSDCGGHRFVAYVLRPSIRDINDNRNYLYTSKTGENVGLPPTAQLEVTYTPAPTPTKALTWGEVKTRYR
jgi:hypothetical protein